VRRLLSRDVVAGAVLCLIGAAFAYFGAGLPFGRARAMGPGFIPTVVAWIVVAMGGAMVVRGALAAPIAIERGRLRPLIAVVGAMVVFGLALEPAGVIAAAVASVAIACLAAPGRSLAETAALAAGLAFVGWLIFVRLLNLPIPVLPAVLQS
jgi:hypothetical protein